MKRLVWFFFGITSFQIVSAQTINLQCELKGSFLQYRGGNLIKEMSCDDTKEKCVATYHVSIQPIGNSSYKLVYSSIKDSSDHGEIDPIKSESKFSNSMDTAYWSGNIFIASSVYTLKHEPYNGRPAYESRSYDNWKINRMTGEVTRHKESSITPVQPKLYTYYDKSTGTCKTFTPKF